MRTLQNGPSTGSTPHPYTLTAWFSVGASFDFSTPPVYECRGMALMLHATGPRAYTSAAIAPAPSSRPYSATLALGNEEMAEQKPPEAANVEQVRHVLAGVHEKSRPDEQAPPPGGASVLSALHASYARHVSYGR